jgi:diguanylate cyclase (GGDEF)-like protein
MEESLHAMTMVDDLTGVYNRRGFMTLADQQLKLARRAKSPIILLYIDLDNLKRVNDSLGHQEGDILLSRTAIVLRRSFREADVLARIGGDEFAVLAVEATRKSIETPLRRLRINLDADNALVDDTHRLVLTTGLACYDPADPRTLEKLLSEADRDMYDRKRQKRTGPSA